MSSLKRHGRALKSISCLRHWSMFFTHIFSILLSYIFFTCADIGGERADIWECAVVQSNWNSQKQYTALYECQNQPPGWDSYLETSSNTHRLLINIIFFSYLIFHSSQYLRSWWPVWQRKGKTAFLIFQRLVTERKIAVILYLNLGLVLM